MGDPHDGLPADATLNLIELLCPAVMLKSTDQAVQSGRLKEKLSLKPRTFDVEADEHPCQLVVKYMCGDAGTFASLGDNLLAWLSARGIELPIVSWQSFSGQAKLGYYLKFLQTRP